MFIRLLSIFFILTQSFMFGQLAVTNNAPNNTEAYLVNDILCDDGLTTSNFSSTGFASGIGYFDGFASNIGFEEGVVLSTGGICLPVPDCNVGAWQGGSGVMGDADLELALNEINLEDLSIGLNPSKEDSILRKYIEEEDRFNLTSSQLLIENKMLFMPVEGTVTQRFNTKENHLAIDIAVDIGTPIKAASDGRVLFAEWTLETGHVVIIDHGDMLITVYKHNSAVLKKQNEFVNAGEIIALSGNHGTLTTGPHLHFELWKNGSPIDPAQLFNFQ